MTNSYIIDLYKILKFIFNLTSWGDMSGFQVRRVQNNVIRHVFWNYLFCEALLHFAVNLPILQSWQPAIIHTLYF